MIAASSVASCTFLRSGCRWCDCPRRTHSYVRHGTTSLFAALDISLVDRPSALLGDQLFVLMREILNALPNPRAMRPGGRERSLPAPSWRRIRVQYPRNGCADAANAVRLISQRVGLTSADVE